MNQEFVIIAFLYILDKQSEDSGVALTFHQILVFIPVIEGTDYMNCCRMRCPYRKEHTLLAAYGSHMCTELFVNVIVRSGSE